ncbi:MAG: 2-oxoacid:acceptor oxidoreductase family protein [Acidobacteriota bacterium]|jgi:2-oxoglutarate ferredoxin oxidoreductase subunit gamma
MAQHDVVIAGFGGQGVLLVGKMLAYAGMRENKEVSWFPSYGPEMRGGTCNCTVIISDRPVGSPVVQHPSAIIVLNLPSLDKFEPLLRSGGLLCVNTSLIHRQPRRDDVRVVAVPANDIAIELANPRGANMVALGAYVGSTGAVSEGVLEEVIQETFAAKPGLVEANLQAFRRGVEVGRAVREQEVTS